MDNLKNEIFTLIKRVTKPYRYIGSEDGCIKKDLEKIKFKACLMFPDMYEVAVSNLGHRILYNILNKNDDMFCDRVYAPAKDLVDLLIENKLPLYGVDLFLPLKTYDVLAVSLLYELSYPTILKMFELGNISINAADRKEDEPIVLGGGVCTYNPEPLKEFFDVFSIGDGEECTIKIFEKVKELKLQKKSRKEILIELSKIDGVYVPSFFKISPKIIKKQNVNLTNENSPQKFPVPLSPSVHDRVVVEIRRGCGRMCRFCQACFTNLPIREKDAEDIIEQVKTSLENTGYEEYSLLSLSSNDYNGIVPLLGCLNSDLINKGISVSLPSQRADKFDIELANVAHSVRKGTITLAIEAGSQRLRDVINKNLNEEQIFNSILSAYRAGWTGVKLYFMIGLPTETYEDLDEIVELLKRIKYRANLCRKEENLPKLLNIVATVSLFVPKAFTPFQWYGQNSRKILEEKSDYLLEKVKPIKGVRLNFHNAFLSQLEAVFARGDENLCKFIQKAYENGSYLDAWAENFNEELWIKSSNEANIILDEYSTKEFCINETLPWDFIDIGVTKEFLKKEYMASKENQLHIACDEKCVNCGACSFSKVKKKINTKILNFDENKLDFVKMNYDKPVFKYRIKVTKRGALKYISHLDFLKLVNKTFKKSKLNVAYSLGFNPQPKIAIGAALPIFIESEGELIDVELYNDISEKELQDAIVSFLHEGCELIKVKKITKKEPSVEMQIHWAQYVATYKKNDDLKKNEIFSKIKHVLSSNELFIEKTNKKGFTKQINIRKSIDTICLCEEKGFLKLSFVLRAAQGNIDGLDILALRADKFLDLISDNLDWDIVRVQLLDENKNVLL